jgi:hypothetical protein
MMFAYEKPNPDYRWETSASEGFKDVAGSSYMEPLDLARR